MSQRSFKGKITFLSLLYKPHIGGVENSIDALSKEFQSSGFEVKVLCTNEPPSYNLELFEIIDNVPVERYSWKHLSWLFFPFSLFFNLFKLSKWLRNKVDDSVLISRHHFMCIALLLAGVRNYIYIIPEVVLKSSEYRTRISFRSRLIMRTSAFLQRQSIIYSKRTYVFSKNVQDQLKSAGVSKKTFLVSPGIDSSKFDISKVEARKRLDLHEDLLIILVLGRVIETKGFQIAIDAMGCLGLTNCKLLVVGDGPYLNHLKLQALEHNLQDRILFKGSTNEPELYFRACDIFLMTSFNEAFGQTILEAAFAKRPIIAFQSGQFGNIKIETATNEILKDEEGVIYCDPTSDRLCLAIKIMIQTYQNSCFEVSYSGVESRYSWSLLAKELLK